MNGLSLCARYAFAPNYLKYCGPDKNQELKGYLQTKTSDAGLKAMLNDFAAMHPYLQLIAKENGIDNEFDERVVDAYWLGNKLLDNVALKSFFNHVNPRLSKKELKWFELKLPQGAKPNHAFHVFNFITRAGHQAVHHTIESMDNCRISWGIMLPKGKVATQKLGYKDKQLQLVQAVKTIKNLVNDFEVGDLVTFHWGWVCEKISQRQAKSLDRYTRLALRLANQTL
ncbi:MAG: hypothetical protein UY17_C0034G0010 [Candidatus Beckwithbacteria bacterium GW2011_GWC2_47_9]|uniref:Uncharacterized protein n=1 Tax=Candidatus Beckwithbacteria bacterium GW2011_GWC2_47_9 TaxID=1618373 RepID=A0A0G1W9E1_9BACT|nr:MAG: hypothetical protein UY17_C0034G0010 [Candidatus Beckwithbacteria bacterium GW2011_GWC2_47_9]